MKDEHSNSLVGYLLP